MKTEHNGAKNGGGHWGTREEAKAMSNAQRRAADRRLSDDARADLVETIRVSDRAHIRGIIRREDRVRIVPTFGSPATLPRAQALRIRDDDNRLLDELRAVGSAEGLHTAYIEEVRRGR